MKLSRREVVSPSTAPTVSGYSQTSYARERELQRHLAQPCDALATLHEPDPAETGVPGSFREADDLVTTVHRARFVRRQRDGIDFAPVDVCDRAATGFAIDQLAARVDAIDPIRLVTIGALGIRRHRVLEPHEHRRALALERRDLAPDVTDLLRLGDECFVVDLELVVPPVDVAAVAEVEQLAIRGRARGVGVDALLARRGDAMRTARDLGDLLGLLGRDLLLRRRIEVLEQLGLCHRCGGVAARHVGPEQLLRARRDHDAARAIRLARRVVRDPEVAQLRDRLVGDTGRALRLRARDHEAELADRLCVAGVLRGALIVARSRQVDEQPLRLGHELVGHRDHAGLRAIELLQEHLLRRGGEAGTRRELRRDLLRIDVIGVPPHHPDLVVLEGLARRARLLVLELLDLGVVGLLVVGGRALPETRAGLQTLDEHHRGGGVIEDELVEREVLRLPRVALGLVLRRHDLLVADEAEELLGRIRRQIGLLAHRRLGLRNVRRDLVLVRADPLALGTPVRADARGPACERDVMTFGAVATAAGGRNELEDAARGEKERGEEQSLHVRWTQRARTPSHSFVVVVLSRRGRVEYRLAATSRLSSPRSAAEIPRVAARRWCVPPASWARASARWRAAVARGPG